MVAKALPLMIVVSVAMWGAPFEGLCQSKQFQAAQRQFEEIADRSVALASDVNSAVEKNECNFFVATAMIYAVRSHCLSQLSDLALQFTSPEDTQAIKLKLLESQAYLNRYTAQDIAQIENLATGSNNTRIRELGLRLANVLRVFDANSQALARN